ncbi:uncharacterized protein JCM15063_003376 [Sporobolomyces koalae]|uniref:uncharacterized protein n=1 Tax=Sporobolomyces koalae TaxID=500713 RepID=UPI0031726218
MSYRIPFFRSTTFRSYSSTLPPCPSGASRFASSSSSSSAHLLHPTTRTTLTNWTFYLCAFVSIATVSLTMSGTTAFGRAGCPASSKPGVGAQEQSQVDEERIESRAGRGGGVATTTTGKRRWLNDPNPPNREEQVWKVGKDGKLVNPTTSTTLDPARTTTETTIGRDRQSEGKGPRIEAQDWRDWVEARQPRTRNVDVSVAGPVDPPRLV